MATPPFSAKRPLVRIEQPSLSTVPDGEVDKVLLLLRPIVEAIAATVGPHCEVVLHDLRVPEHSIIAISNGSVSGRRIGGAVVGGPMKDVALRLLDSGIKESTLTVGYKTQTRDGRELRSTTLVLRTPAGKPVVALCMNIDLSTINMAKRMLDEISRIGTAGAAPVSEDTPQTDVTEVIAQIIQEAFEEVGKSPKFMNREDRLHAIRLMHERGLFLIRGGVERAAEALGVSRFTLYGYLKEIRSA